MPSPQLEMIFEWGTPTVPAGYAGPVIELRFEEVRVLEWDEDPVESDAERPHLGEVRGFEYTDGVFTLATLNLELTFAAQRCIVIARS
jgi:hypothetical protein